jgi:RHS repeat-associated protein
MLVPSRHGSSEAYRYGFQGQEKDDELKGEGNSYNFGARMLDPRIGRFFTIDPDFEDYPSTSPYLYANNSPLYFIDHDGKGPRPAPKLIEATIHNFGDFWFRAFKASNNTSTGHFNDWVRGRAKSDGRSKALGAIGEGTFAASLDAVAFPNTKVAFGSEIYGKAATKLVQVDVVEITVIGTYKGKLLGGGLGKKIINYNFNGTEKDPIIEERSYTGLRTIVQNYEIKTLNPDSNVGKLYQQLSKGVDQAIKNGLTTEDDVYGVLVTDQASWEKVANDKTYGNLLKAKYELLTKSGNVLRLQKGLYEQSQNNLDNLVEIVKNTPEK